MFNQFPPGQYPPPQGGYPPQQGGYPPQQGGFPPQDPISNFMSGAMQAISAGFQQQGQLQQGGPQRSYYQPLPSAMAYSQQQVYRPPGYNEPPNIKQWFDSVDLNRNGSISPMELQAALARGNHPFNLSTAEKVVRLFDKDRTGALGFPEFAEAHLFCENMSRGFQSRDLNGSGELDGNESRMALQASGYIVQEGTFQILMHLFDRRKAGGLTFDDYVEMCIFLHNVKNVYGFYDRQRTDQVTFNFDAFLTAAVTLRSL